MRIRDSVGLSPDFLIQIIGFFGKLVSFAVWYKNLSSQHEQFSCLN
jgi:hypothetical protein